MRLLHTSDTHLGHQQYARIDPETGLNQREVDHMAAWHAIVDHAIETGPDVFVHAGDLFDGVRPSNRALAAALDGFRSLSAAGIETVLIAGNHEHPKMRATGSPFRLLEHLPHVHPVYKGRAESVGVAGAMVHGVPQCSDGDVLRSEVARVAAGPDDVLILHGAVMDLPAFHHAEFNEQTLEPAWFKDVGYVALGHYHGRTEVAPNAWYCGAPERVSLAEAKEEKGFLEVDVQDGGPPDVTWQGLRTRPYIDASPIDAAGMDAEQVQDAVMARVVAAADGAVMRQRITAASPDLRGSLDIRGMKEAGAHLLHLDIDVVWDDEASRTAGSVRLRGLRDEFEEFVAAQRMEGRDRERLTKLALELLAGDAA